MQELLLGCQPFGEGTIHWKNQETNKKKKARTNAWWSTFWKGDFSLEKSRNPRKKRKNFSQLKKKKNARTTAWLSTFWRGYYSLEKSRNQ